MNSIAVYSAGSIIVPRRSVPTLRRKNDRGRYVAVVTLPDSVTGKRRDFWCGHWGTDEANRKYAAIIGQWEIDGRCWPQETLPQLTVAEIIVRYWRWAEPYYAKGESQTIRAAWRVLEAVCADIPATAFGPIKVRAVRQAMIAKGWNRTFINRQIHRVSAIFKWAASNELLPVAVYQALKTVEPLKRGRCEAPESEPVLPVAIDQVASLRVVVSRQVWALIELQRLTGARAGELVGLRPCDIDRSGEIWRTVLADHKTAHHGKRREIYFGPQAQDVIRPFLLRPDDKPLFSPAEAEDERIKFATTSRSTPAGQGNVATGKRREVGDVYTTASYRRAIARGCKRAKISHWHPHQLRHTAATEIRRQFGLEAAAAVLGHSSAKITDAVYAERDRRQVEGFMRQIG